MATIAFNALFNFTGHPSIVIPIARTKNNLPIGIQIVGKRWDDMRLLAIVRELEKIQKSPCI